MHSPQVLELTAADELVALENVDVLRQNGFELAVCEDRPPGQRVQLDARPISKSTVFDTKGASQPCSRACSAPLKEAPRRSRRASPPPPGLPRGADGALLQGARHVRDAGV